MNETDIITENGVHETSYTYETAYDGYLTRWERNIVGREELVMVSNSKPWQHDTDDWFKYIFPKETIDAMEEKEEAIRATALEKGKSAAKDYLLNNKCADYFTKSARKTLKREQNDLLAELVQKKAKGNFDKIEITVEERKNIIKQIVKNLTDLISFDDMVKKEIALMRFEEQKKILPENILKRGCDFDHKGNIEYISETSASLTKDEFIKFLGEEDAKKLGL